MTPRRTDAPPRAAYRLLRRALPPGSATDSLLGDLHEEYLRFSPRALRKVWYAGVAVRLALDARRHHDEPALSTLSRLPDQPRRKGAMRLLDSVSDDLKFSWRLLVRRPAFTAIAVTTLALGIGANTAIYTLVDAVALKPLPVSKPNELYRLGDTYACCVNSGLQRSFSLFSYPLYQHFRAELTEFSGLAAFSAQVMPFSVRRVGANAPAQPVVGEFVSANYFTALGVPMAAGRGLVDDDDRPGAPPAAILSYRAWRDQYGLDPAVVGASFSVGAGTVTIAGIAAPEFFGETLRANPPDLWLPLGLDPAIRGSASLTARTDQHWLYIIGRLGSGAAVPSLEARASAELRAWLDAHTNLAADEKAQLPDQHIVITSAATGVSTLRTRYADALQVLAIVSVLVLLVACANLANLLLARTQPFQFGMRAALGASRGRLVQQTLTSGVMLAIVGGLAGVLVAYAATRAIIAMAFRGSQYVPIDTTPSLSVLGFTSIVSILTGVVFTAVPAWIMSRANPIEALRGVGRSTADKSALSRQGLVILQVAVSLVLLVGAGLLTTSLYRLQHQDFGFQTSGRLMVSVNPVVAGYKPDRLPGLYDRLQDQLSRVPGVERVSLSQYSPMEGMNWSGAVSVEGRPIDPGRHDSASWLRVGAHYFETVGTRLVRGRPIDERDTPGSTHVTVVSERFAREFFGEADPIGRHLGFGEDPAHTMDYEVVGVVEDAKYVRAAEPGWAMYFLPLLQAVTYRSDSLMSMQTRSMFINDIVLRVTDGSPNLEAEVRRAIAAVDPNLPVTSVVSFEEQLDRNFNQQRLVARLTTLYGQLALLLAMVGLYGITAQSVTRRTGEIGLRMALGADRRRVLGMVLGRAMTQTLIGLSIGVPVALGAGGLLAGQLYGVSGHDAFVLGGSILVLAACAIGAAFVPARRAATLDPVTALRGD